MRHRIPLPLVLVAIAAVLATLLLVTLPDDDGDTGGRTRAIGESAEVGGAVVDVVAARFEATLGPGDEEGYLVVEVGLRNDGDDELPYNTFDWTLVRPDGSSVEPFLGGDQLGAGSLAPGADVGGRVIFEVGADPGEVEVAYRPADGGDGARWRVPE